MLPIAAAASASSSPPIRLRCLAGGALGDDAAESAKRVTKLTPKALGGLGAVLHACVSGPMTPELGERLTRFCLAHEVAEADLGHVVKVCRLLLREASAADLTKEDFEQDVRAVFGDSQELLDVIQREYDVLRPTLRTALLSDALVQHGNVLVDLDWRIDVLAADRHALKLGVPIALVTLHYRNADRNERLTLQLTSEQLQRLEQTLGALAQRTRRPLP